METRTTDMNHLTRMNTAMNHLTGRKMDVCEVKAKRTTLSDEINFWERKGAFQKSAVYADFSYILTGRNLRLVC